MENQTNKQPQTNENYPDSVKIEQDALRMNESNVLPEKTWDGPLGEAVRDATNEQDYGKTEAQPRPEIEPDFKPEPEIQPAPERPDTAMPSPLSNPDTNPQVQPPTIIENPVAEYDSQANEQENKSSEDLEEETIEHSEQGNMNDMRGYNEPKNKESEYYK